MHYNYILNNNYKMVLFYGLLLVGNNCDSSPAIDGSGIWRASYELEDEVFSPVKATVEMEENGDFDISLHSQDFSIDSSGILSGRNIEVVHYLDLERENRLVIRGRVHGDDKSASGDFYTNTGLSGAWHAVRYEPEKPEHAPADRLKWAVSSQSVDSFDEIRSESIALLTDGSIVVTGSFFGTAVFSAEEENPARLTSSGCCDIFLAKYDENGELVWVKKAGSDADNCHYIDKPETGNAVKVLPDGSIWVVGTFSDTAVFGRGEANQVSLVSAGTEEDSGETDIFLARFDSDGDLQWVVRAGSRNDDDYGNGLAVADDGSAYITGTFGNSNIIAPGKALGAVFGEGEVNERELDPVGGDNIFIAHYNPDGSLNWVNQAVGDESDEGLAIALTDDDSLAVSGSFRQTAVFGESNGNDSVSITSQGEQDGFIALYHKSGSLNWVHSVGGAGFDDAKGISSDGVDRIYLVGTFEDMASFGQGQQNEISITSNGEADLYLASYDHAGQLHWVTTVGGPQYDSVAGVSVATDGSLFIAGEVQGHVSFGKTQASSKQEIIIRPEWWGYSPFLAQYDTNGHIIWATAADSHTLIDGFVTGLAAISDGSAVITGGYGNEIIFGMWEKNETKLVNSSGWIGLFLAKY